jgi:hypothetical protein
MKIIKAGTPPVPTSMEVKCKKCRAVLEITASDIETGDDDGPNRPGCKFVTCPTIGCGRMVILDGDVHRQLLYG